MALRLHPRTRDLLRQRLGESHPARAFAEAVTAHLAVRPAEEGNDVVRERQRATQVAEILRGIERSSGKPLAPPLDVELLSSFFQNADLLEPGTLHADGIAWLLNDRLTSDSER